MIDAGRLMALVLAIPLVWTVGPFIEASQALTDGSAWDDEPGGNLIVRLDEAALAADPRAAVAVTVNTGDWFHGCEADKAPCRSSVPHARGTVTVHAEQEAVYRFIIPKGETGMLVLDGEGAVVSADLDQTTPVLSTILAAVPVVCMIIGAVAFARSWHRAAFVACAVLAVWGVMVDWYAIGLGGIGAFLAWKLRQEVMVSAGSQEA